MGVRICSKSKLDSNVYMGLTIREVDGLFTVKVNCSKDNGSYELLSYKLTDRLKGLSDYDKVINIVDSFLESTTIDSIEVEKFCKGSRGSFIVVGGTRCLCLQIENHDLLTQIVKMIKSKYDRDRYKYLDESVSDLYSVGLSDKKSSYGKEFIPCEDCDYVCDLDYCPKTVSFNVMYSKGKILGFDRMFLERFVYDKLWESGYRAIIYEKKKDIKLVDGITVVGSYVDAYYIICGDFKIKFKCSGFTKEYVESFCKGLVNRYNSEFEEKQSFKKRQLKMEGF